MSTTLTPSILNVAEVELLEREPSKKEVEKRKAKKSKR